MKKTLILLFTLISMIGYSQSKDEQAVRDLLARQSSFWNKGDIENFMKGYWDNDSLMFVGKSGVTYGYKSTLENYKKGYPDRSAMGELNFTLIKIEKLSPEYIFLVGKWHLKRTIGDVQGHFNLLFKKINNDWVIIVDHSS
ncbi:MAG: nuclear transport factor 2 family protein [Chitinophagaceae bacterium]|jgi:ketosteroid isomerase-like protein|nr:nuclear transport factor 2 family protein [Chitinophagaceae bacterium]